MRKMNSKYLIVPLCLITLLLSSDTLAGETCSRLAIINYQEVLIDTNSTQKGEGLRHYLEKDPIAKKYLESYQKGNRLNFINTVLGSAGTILILAGILTNGQGDRRQNLLIAGGALVGINFLIAKTISFDNEKNLERSIEEYNKRNLPRIYFSPLSMNNALWGKKEGIPLAINFSRMF